MVSQTTYSSSSSSSSSSSNNHDVFLSFCGVDTRTNFTDRLYTALVQKGINTFKDDEKLEQGKYISPELLKAIEKSEYAIIVLSINYASSRWCLIELAKIVECMKENKLTIFPVFYQVDPSDVRNLTGTFAKSFAEHVKNPKVNTDDVKVWKAALKEVGNISGWHVHDRRESDIIEDLVRKILGKLTYIYSICHNDLVGIKSRMDELENLLVMESNEVRFLGIWGMGGMGKTTLAQVVYERYRAHFHDSSFLANVREKSGNIDGLVSLQKQLLSDILTDTSTNIPDFKQGITIIRKRLCHKKVLIILDDVDQSMQLNALAGEKNWFGQGSRIIITTRDHGLLIRHEVAEAQIYKLKELDNAQSLKLFSRKAFKKDYPQEGYAELCQKFVNYTKGLPLALEVLGSFLFCRSPNLWKSTLGRIEKSPPKNILDVLKISFDGLEDREKSIFLDIACFFKGEFKSRVTFILETLYDNPDIDIEVLQEKSLITITREGFQMHDLLQQLGKIIARGESPEEVARRSRL